MYKLFLKIHVITPQLKKHTTKNWLNLQSVYRTGNSYFPLSFNIFQRNFVSIYQNSEGI